MKKMILLLTILVGCSVLGMAKSCEEKYFWSDMPEKEMFLGMLVVENDLECLKYFIDIKGLDLNKAEVEKGTTLINKVFKYYNPQILPETLSFIIKHGIKPTNKDMADIFFRLNSKLIVENSQVILTEPMLYEKFKLLTKEGGPDVWKAIDDDTVNWIINQSVNYNDIGTYYIKLLLDCGLPLSEYNRYINAVKKRIEGEKDLAKIETGKQIIQLLEQSRESRIQEMTEKIKKTVNEIEIKRLEKYNYSF